VRSGAERLGFGTVSEGEDRREKERERRLFPARERKRLDICGDRSAAIAPKENPKARFRCPLRCPADIILLVLLFVVSPLSPLPSRVINLYSAAAIAAAGAIID